MDWQLKQFLTCARLSVTACTSWTLFLSNSSNLLAKVDTLAFSSISLERAYMPPLWFTGGLNLSASLGFGSSQPLEVSAT